MGAGAMSAAYAVKVIGEIRRRQRRRQALDLKRLTFGPQRAFVTDPAPYVAASCSRQGGKTYGIGVKLVDKAADNPGKECLYLTNARPQARSIMWPVLHELNDSLKLGGKFNETRLRYTLPNGGAVQLGGANDAVEIERYRGPQYPLAVLDEAQSFRPFIKYLVNEIIRPGQAKYGKKAQIMLTGTPNASRSGYLYDVVTGAEEGWNLHHWTIHQNPHIPDVEAFIADILKRRGLTMKDAAIRREFFGEWVRDAASQVYKVRPKNEIERLPEGVDDWRHVIGIDFGFVGVTAFCVLAYSVKAGRIVVVESFQELPPKGEESQTVENLARKIQGLRQRYPRVTGIVGDPGGLGATFIKDLRKRHNIPITAAEKNEKQAAIELMNGDLRTETMLIVKGANEDLLHDAANLQWRWDRVDEKKHGGNVSRLDLLVDDRYPDHLTDAWTYAFRECRHYFKHPGENQRHPPVGSNAYDEYMDQKREEDAMAAGAESSDWMGGGGVPDADPLGLGYSGFGL